jgi:hypothetical protein
VTSFRRLMARRTARAGLVALVVGALTGGYFAVSAIAAPAIPAPAITSSPANPTSSTTASFTYTDSQPGVIFECQIDGDGFITCPRAGMVYYGLAAGSHTFAVDAVSGHSASSPTTYAWVVDTTVPALTVSFPADDHVYNAAGWSAGCTPPGICGTAADPEGVSTVAVSIYQESSGLYWNGSSFSSLLPILHRATGTASWQYGFTPPTAGEYEAVVEATDSLGNTTTARVRFSFETAGPPAPRVTAEPSSPSTDASPEFHFIDRDWPHVTFWCSVDSGPVVPCTGDTDHDNDGPPVEGELHLHNLSAGPHCFSVYARDEAGSDSPPAQYCWTIAVTSAAFMVGGDLTSPLAPGVSEPLDMTFTNPSSSPITIAVGGIASANITITPNQAGCGASNFEVSQGLARAVTIPADQATPISLSALGVPRADWPVITMIDTTTNQDACEGATLTLTYSGIEATG